MIQKPISCDGCQLRDGEYGTSHGYVPQDGSGDNGVLIVLEAAGEDEAACGKPVVGRAGQFLWTHLKRVGIEREGFRIHNVLSCRPPDNKLLKMPYTDRAIEHCSPNLDATIMDHTNSCRDLGITPVIVALGKFSFKWLMGIQSDNHPILREDYLTYPHWLEKYGCWMIAAPHPSHIMQGKNNLVPTLQFVFQRALEIANEGLILDNPTYLLDPEPVDFTAWVNGYRQAYEANPLDTYLSYDIETPYKSGKDEDEVAREDDDDYIILRCGFAYNLPDGSIVASSVQWIPELMGEFEGMFGRAGAFGVNWNGSGYDDVRIRQQLPLNLITLDAMLAWHVLNTSLPKALGYVTPFYVKNTSMWKHLATPPKDMPPTEARRQEAFYNAKDADMALRCWLEIKKDLIGNGLWEVFERHVVRLNEVLTYMSGMGVMMDRDARLEAEQRLGIILKEIWARMQNAVPLEARNLKVYKKEPTNETKESMGMVTVDGIRTTKRCSRCGTDDVRADHFKSVGAKRLGSCGICGVSAKKHPDLDHTLIVIHDNPCVGAESIKVEVEAKLWAEPQPFKISKKSLTAYQAIKKHQPFKDRKTKQVTFDIKAIKQLIAKYPDDLLYPIISDYRKIQKLASTYVGVTQYKEVKVDGHYQLQDGERWLNEDDCPAVDTGWHQDFEGREDSHDVQPHTIDAEASE